MSWLGCGTFTHRENTLRGIGPTALNAAKERCHKGHPLTADNLVASQHKKGWRLCRICYNQYHRDRRRRTAVKAGCGR